MSQQHLINQTRIHKLQKTYKPSCVLGKRCRLKPPLQVCSDSTTLRCLHLDPTSWSPEGFSKEVILQRGS